MRLLAALLFVALPAHADLYRWIDPETGSIKFSNLPPSDASIKAEVIPSRVPAPPPAPAKPKPVAEPSAAAAGAGPVAALEGRWSELLTQLTGVAPSDFNKGAEGLRQHMEAYEAVRVELDRLDPSGAARRKRESTSMLDRLKQGFAAQFSTTPPGQK